MLSGRFSRLFRFSACLIFHILQFPCDWNEEERKQKKVPGIFYVRKLWKLIHFAAWKWTVKSDCMCVCVSVSWLAIFDKCFRRFYNKTLFTVRPFRIPICHSYFAPYARVRAFEHDPTFINSQLGCNFHSRNIFPSNNNCIIDEQKADERPSFCNSTLSAIETMRGETRKYSPLLLHLLMATRKL